MVRQEVEKAELGEEAEGRRARLREVVKHLGWSRSSFFRKPLSSNRRPGPKRKEIAEELAEVIRAVAREHGYWGYKRLAVVLRRRGVRVRNRQVYRVLQEADLLQKPQPRKAELYQATKLFDLLPKAANDLWQTDVTYLHIPNHGWWYAVTVIDYFSRYLLAVYLTHSFSAAEIIKGLKLARQHAESIHGPLKKPPLLVTDNGSSFIAKSFREHISGLYSQVRTRYRTPEQLGLLERFHRTLKREEIYWHIYDSPAEAREKLAAFHSRYNEVRPHWALTPIAGGDPVTPDDVYRGKVEVGIPAWQTWVKEAREKLDKMMEEDAAKAA